MSEWQTCHLDGATISTWQPYYRERLTAQEAVEILTRVGQLFAILFSENKEESTNSLANPVRDETLPEPKADSADDNVAEG
jgi:hypothetical protein